ncbi:MAG TPA: DUF552 domain-containing protein [Candidatus Altiarchaeales archaeon]|nr:DUF552 domain-containing protein [Candidatus Altiarchaeales archaeon]
MGGGIMVFDKFKGGSKQATQGEIDIEDYLNDLSVRDGKLIESEDTTYVKSLSLDAEGKGVGNVMAELEKNNVIVLNVKSLSHHKGLLKNIVKELRDAAIDLDGDIGRISETKLLIVPAGMRIVQGSGEQQ